MLTQLQLHRAVQKIPDVKKFCAQYGLSRRTVSRVKKRGYVEEATLQRKTIELIECALFMEGLVSGDTNRRKPAGRRMARRKPEKMG